MGVYHDVFTSKQNESYSVDLQVLQVDENNHYD